MADILSDIVPGVGIGLNAISALMKNANAERERRFRNYIRTVNLAREKQLATTYQRNAGVMGEAVQGATSRSAASGRLGQAEALILPAQDRAAQGANENVQNANRYYDEKVLDATADFENRPIDPSGLDVAATLAGELGQYGLARKRLDILKNLQSLPAADMLPADPITASATGGEGGGIVPPTETAVAADDTSAGLPPEQSQFSPYVPYWKKPRTQSMPSMKGY